MAKEVAGVYVSRNLDRDYDGVPSINVGGWDVTEDDLTDALGEAKADEFGTAQVGAYYFNVAQLGELRSILESPDGDSASRVEQHADQHDAAEGR